ncbi:hypothetical protein [Prochlorococcus sp. MIT 0602]|uniref:hypothetical protein n=2 Tax=Prochlorococcus TaxID=1218 RepID=UPI000564FE0E|nr:hypothetical protein [Prochlorococcus sp. MIT 0602]
MPVKSSLYRLVGMDGHPHPVLDMQYESIDAAIRAAKNWNSGMNFDDSRNSDSKIGIEVMTSNGSWRTIKYS